MASKSAIKEAVKNAQRLVADEETWPGVHAAFRGTKKTAGKDTGRECVVFYVVKKIPENEIVSGVIPPAFRAFGEAIETDVVEHPLFEAHQIDPRQRIRPVPGGVSYGHVDITTGTLGGWVKFVSDDQWYALTNAHVAADTNKGDPDDAVLQPGPFDGGRHPSDIVGTLARRVAIHFGDTAPTEPTCPAMPPPPPDPDPDDPKKKSSVASVYWKGAAMAVNALPKLFGCPFRATVINEAKMRLRASAAAPFCIPQPWPNLVDAALAGPVGNGLVDPNMTVGPRPFGIADPDVGDRVRKMGRTTNITFGRVIGMDAVVRVSYGDDGVALFEDQIIVEGDAGDFSAGGDSGSWIIRNDESLVALLYAGGGGQTIGNRITNVFSLLGIRL